MKKPIQTLNRIAPTEVQLNHLKAQYGKLFEVSLVDDDIEYVFLFKRPDRITLAAATEKDMNPIDAAYTIAINTLVFGDEKLLEDGVIFTAVSRVINEMITGGIATLKKI